MIVGWMLAHASIGGDVFQLCCVLSMSDTKDGFGFGGEVVSSLASGTDSEGFGGFDWLF